MEIALSCPGDKQAEAPASVAVLYQALDPDKVRPGVCRGPLRRVDGAKIRRGAMELKVTNGIRRVFARSLACSLLAGFLWLGAGQVLGTADAFAGSCDACKTEYNKCRIQRRGNASCDRDYEACLRNCVKSSRRR
jgi:hypothetical protein